ncbi:MAG: Regulatory protein BlaR1 [Pedosphaera sp.]|nr:Regulatory protein BlaR1 [Pedosphaera sp.]
MVGNASALDLDMARFVTAKRAQAKDLAGTQTNKVPPIVWSFFDAVRVDDWETATNLAARVDNIGRYAGINADSLSPALQTAIWPVISETIGTYEQFHKWDNKLLHRFGSNIIASIPKGSVYFGGTDSGRFVISALSESHRDGRPFFTFTQNQLADGRYLEYLRTMYGRKLYIPSMEDSQKAFEGYVADAGERLKAGKLKPGEDVRTVEGRIQVNGQVAVMEINGLLIKIILEKNPNREFYIEESFPLDWMYPYLSPHDLILELHHKPLTGLDEETLQRDYNYWKQFTGELIGDWITDKTSVKEVCDFADKVYSREDRAGFKGNTAFAKNDQSQKCFSKLRSSIASLYVWRMQHANGEPEKYRMRKAADLAFRQALALCPYSPEAIYRYSNFLVELKRPDEAIQIAETCIRLDPDDSWVKEFARQLRKSN